MSLLPQCWRVPLGSSSPLEFKYIETLITYRRNTPDNCQPNQFAIRLADRSNLKNIFRIIRLVRWHSRLFADARISNETAYAIKECYVRDRIENTFVVTHLSPKLHGPTTYVVGFMVVENGREGQEIGLIGVDPNWRRMGIGEALIYSLKGDVVMRTQASNVKCQQFLESLGFVEQYREDTYHSEGLYENTINRQ